MPVSTKDISDMFAKDVFTNKGFYCGKVSDIEFDLARYKVRSLVVEAAKNSLLGKAVGGKRGVVIPYPMVQSVGDVVIIKHITESLAEEEPVEEPKAQATKGAMSPMPQRGQLQRPLR
ncbi:MAG: PRC-barrel domain-containing protein [Candidatus Aenigmarchaeota archaeon]|nr:PRC-barrel domain-containing protein [Candidatus Aenigmarchaeota archaeon]